MWRERAAGRAALIVGVVVVAACVGWAVLAQTVVPPACDAATAVPGGGSVTCALTTLSPAP
ncbi:hypothetical protein VD659_08520 [Herbiconiux sp. 11R-BC]|uniref:hypothetical protein n=1 Tax=Herbiconiux sp. 11R-BC TaxID=3111637 RepID=UPI003BFF3787